MEIFALLKFEKYIHLVYYFNGFLQISTFPIATLQLKLTVNFLAPSFSRLCIKKLKFQLNLKIVIFCEKNTRPTMLNIDYYYFSATEMIQFDLKLFVFLVYNNWFSQIFNQVSSEILFYSVDKVNT
jgi:hypothetical protein